MNKVKKKKLIIKGVYITIDKYHEMIMNFYIRRCLNLEIIFQRYVFQLDNSSPKWNIFGSEVNEDIVSYL